MERGLPSLGHVPMVPLTSSLKLINEVAC